MVVINPKKKAYVNYVGAYDLEHISEFLERVLGGQKRLLLLPGPLPAVVDEAAAGTIPPPTKQEL